MITTLKKVLKTETTHLSLEGNDADSFLRQQEFPEFFFLFASSLSHVLCVMFPPFLVATKFLCSCISLRYAESGLVEHSCLFVIA